jgi:hypothetical protein
MGSTTRTKTPPVRPEETVTLAWRVWPLADKRRWSWLVLVVIAGVGAGVWYLGGGLLLAIVATCGLAATLWQFFLPVEYEVAPHGLRRRVVGRTRLVPWHAIRAYRLRPAGVVFYQRSDPGNFDLLRSLFIPYPPDADELLCAVRRHASHATELPQ